MMYCSKCALEAVFEVAPNPHGSGGFLLLNPPLPPGSCEISIETDAGTRRITLGSFGANKPINRQPNKQINKENKENKETHRRRLLSSVHFQNKTNKQVSKQASKQTKQANKIIQPADKQASQQTNWQTNKTKITDEDESCRGAWVPQGGPKGAPGDLE